MTKRRFVHRILTAVVGAGLICLVTSLGAWPLGLALLLVGLVTQGEVYRLYKYCGKEAWYFAGLVLGAMLCMRSLIPGILPAIVLNVILILGWASVKRPEDVLERLRVTCWVRSIRWPCWRS